MKLKRKNSAAPQTVCASLRFMPPASLSPDSATSYAGNGQDSAPTLSFQKQMARFEKRHVIALVMMGSTFPGGGKSSDVWSVRGFAICGEPEGGGPQWSPGRRSRSFGPPPAFHAGVPSGRAGRGNGYTANDGWQSPFEAGFRSARPIPFRKVCGLFRRGHGPGGPSATRPWRGIRETVGAGRGSNSGSMGCPLTLLTGMPRFLV